MFIKRLLASLMFDEPGDKGGLEVNLPGDGKDDLDLLTPSDDVDDKDDKKDDDNSSSDDDGDDADDAEGDGKDDSADDKGDDAESEDADDNDDADDKDDKKKPAKDKEDNEEDLVRHSYSAIKGKYPELFKDFPGLKQAFFREQEFTKIFPTVDDARRAIAAQENFSDIRDTILQGDARTLLTQIKETSPEGLEAFTGNFLSDLRKVDKDQYVAVTTPVLKEVLIQAFKEGNSKRDSNLINSAKILHQAIFGGDYEDITKETVNSRVNKEEDPERTKLNKDREAFLQTKANTIRGEIWTSVEKDLTREIEKGLDPNNSIRPGMKKLIVEKIFNEITKKVAGDAEHIKRMDALWERERKGGFSGTLKESIKTTYLSRAKSLVPSIRQRIRAEVVGAQKKEDGDKRDKLKSNNKPNVDAGKNINRQNGSLDKKTARGKSDMDIIMHGVK